MVSPGKRDRTLVRTAAFWLGVGKGMGRGGGKDGWEGVLEGQEPRMTCFARILDVLKISR